MSKTGNALREIHRMDALALRDQWVNRIHPLVKFMLTVSYILLVVSFQKYDLAGLLGMLVYPLAVFLVADLSFAESLRRIWVILPFICLVGIWNPLFDRNRILVGTIQVNMGVISMLTLLLKGLFCVLASYLLIATTPLEHLCYAFRLLRIPKLLVTQFMLTYRYITVLLKEVRRINQAYRLRAPGQKGVHFKVWGSLAGQLFLRSVDRANEVYESMLLRGYQGDYQYLKGGIRFHGKDLAYLLFWLGIFVFFRFCPVILLAGNLAGRLFG